MAEKAQIPAWPTCWELRDKKSEKLSQELRKTLNEKPEKLLTIGETHRNCAKSCGPSLKKEKPAKE